jgi:hypothetical protein
MHLATFLYTWFLFSIYRYMYISSQVFKATFETLCVLLTDERTYFSHDLNRERANQDVDLLIRTD